MTARAFASTSVWVIATKSGTRWFDLDAVRAPGNPDAVGNQRNGKSRELMAGGDLGPYTAEMHAAGAPPLDWWSDPDEVFRPLEHGENMGSARYIIGDTREVVASIPDGSVDLVLTSPPFLALRSYLPADHEDKLREIGSESSPADFLDVLLDLVEEWGRVLAPHGSIAVELGDTFSGSGGAGGDYGKDGLREGQNAFAGSGYKEREHSKLGKVQRDDHEYSVRSFATAAPRHRSGSDWPQAKSLCLIPQLFAGSLAYGRNLLRPERQTPAWRVRNWITWARPNPPVGALGDKVRPASSFFTVATKSATRWFDLDAVRSETRYPSNVNSLRPDGHLTGSRTNPGQERYYNDGNPAGAPPLDWWSDPEDDYATAMLIEPTAPFKGAHYATWSPKVAKRMVDMQCPLRVCRVCGEPSRRIVERDMEAVEQNVTARGGRSKDGRGDAADPDSWWKTARFATVANNTVGWSDCECTDDSLRRQLLSGAISSTDGQNVIPPTSKWRPGLVLDPFAGSGTTLAVASGSGRDSIGVDIDARNADLALERVGPLMLTVERFGSENVA